MSRIKQEIVRSMSGFEVTADRDITAHFTFPAEFVGFQGHFPAKKILPGVCQIQCILVMLEKYKDKTVTLREIIQAKFISPVYPKQKITCVCKNPIADGEDFIVRALINCETGRIAQLKLRVSI